MPQNAKIYSPTLYDAIELAARAHHHQVRKGTEIPYIVHPLAVANLLIRVNSPEPLVIAGLLHDVIEDTPVTIQDILAGFGPEVAELVTALSEPDKKASWEDRKTHTIEYLEKKASDAVVLVALADKLDNIRAIREGLESDGERFWARFNRPREKQRWYYERLAAAFATKVSRQPALRLLAAFKAEVERVFHAPRSTPDAWPG
jgi:(p)ppGpp synthase/HD superfamily hydrolase